MSGGYSEGERSNNKQQEVRTESPIKNITLTTNSEPQERRRCEGSSLLDYDAVPSGKWYRRFQEACSFHHQGSSSNITKANLDYLRSDDGGSELLRNIGKYLLVST
jgi:hypothetical protein